MDEERTSTTTAKRGRPRRYVENVWFGMKVTPEEKLAIKTLAALEGKPASRALMDLVIRTLKSRGGKLNPRELMELEPHERERILTAQAKKAKKIYSQLTPC